MVIAIDFDGTLVNGKVALPGAREAINILREKGHQIIIFSCNGKDWIERVMRDNDMRYDYISEGTHKPVAHVYIDDRGIGFRGDWEATLKEVEQIAGFKSDKQNGGLW